MTVATITRSEYLKAAERVAVATDGATAALWGEDAATSRQSSPLTVAADADAEAARQLADLKLPRAIDAVVLTGLHRDLVGKTISVPYAGQHGVAGSALLLVTRAQLNRSNGSTTVTGQVRL